ncbi:unnamed protein product [Sphagnum jensenii]|uniref:Uncharacterized protein n=1 Tax=Sphagnum jensenii TaxID=128206 RepID=A0ABP1C0N7_9BRYO
MVNLMQRSDSKTDVRDNDGAMKRATGKSDAEGGSSSWYAHGTSKRMVAHESESDYDSNEDSDEGTQPIQWAVDGEQRKQNLSEAANTTGESVLLQIQQMEITVSSSNVKERIIDDRKEDTRTSGLNLEAQLRRREGYSLSDVVGNQSGLELLGDDGHETGDVRPADDEACAEDTSKNDIWEDEAETCESNARRTRTFRGTEDLSRNLPKVLLEQPNGMRKGDCQGVPAVSVGEKSG